MTQNLSNLLKILLQERIDFVVVGGFAGVIHGSSMVTKDLDVCFVLTPENIEKLRVALKGLNPFLRISPQKLSFLDYPKNAHGLKNLYLGTDLGVIDIIGEVTGVGGFEKLSKNALVVKIFGYQCKVMSLVDLIAAKIALGREKDLAMVKELKVIQENESKITPSLEKLEE